MTSHQSIFSLLALAVILSFPALLTGAPSPQRDQSNSIVFNVWEFARVAAPRPQPAAAAPALDESESSSRISTCVWAITACCQASNGPRRNSCFEALGCGGVWFSGTQQLCTRDKIEASLQTIARG